MKWYEIWKQNSRVIICSEQFRVCRIWGFHSGGYEEYQLLGYNDTCLLTGFLLNLFLLPWWWRRYVPPKRLLTLNGLHGVISQKLILFILGYYSTRNFANFTGNWYFSGSKIYAWIFGHVVRIWETGLNTESGWGKPLEKEQLKRQRRKLENT
jgi:hypothetical protein